MANTIKFKRGAEASIPIGASGEPLWTTDTKKLFIGDGVTNHEIQNAISPAALTKTDDTNVTLTLGGTPATALLQATSIAAGWTGQLAISRGGTGGNLYGGWDLISTAVASNSATIDFTGLSNTYTTYKIEVSNLVMATNATSIWFRVGTGGTPTYQSGAADYGWIRIFAATIVGTNSSSADSKISIGPTNTMGTTATRSYNAEITIVNPSQTTDYHAMFYSSGYLDNSGTYVVQSGYGTYQQTTAVTAVRILSSSGNIASGTFKFYGIR